MATCRILGTATLSSEPCKMQMLSCNDIDSLYMLTGMDNPHYPHRVAPFTDFDLVHDNRAPGDK
eukprot:394818-Prorocentrum_lima.AAC.1